MKVALVTDTYPPSVDGVSHMTSKLAKELSKRHEVIVLTMGRETKTEVKDWEVHKLKGACLKSYPQYRYRIRLPKDWVRNKFREFKPDVVHVQTPMTMGASAEAVARETKLPMVSTFHTALVEFATEMIREGNLEVNPVTKALMNFPLVKRILLKTADIASFPAYYSFFAASDSVTSPSDAVTKVLLENQVKSSKIHKVPNFIETKPEYMPAREFREKWGIEGFMALHVGRLSWEKRIHEIIRTAKTMKDATFVITSDGPLAGELKKRAAGLDNVIFTGYLPYRELYGAYAACDSFFAASPYETFNISAAQAMAFGKPIVGPNKMGLTEFIEHGANGFLVETDNGAGCFEQALRTIMEDGTLKRKMGRNSRRKSAEFRKDKIVRKFEDVYNQTVHNGVNRGKYVYALTLLFTVARAMRV